MRRAIALVLALYIYAATTSFAAESPVWTDFEARKVMNLKCLIERNDKTDVSTLHVQTFGSASTPLTNHVYSIRKSISEAMKDCKDWMKEGQKRIWRAAR